jgi:Fe2+ transport system protein FeoA
MESLVVGEACGEGCEGRACEGQTCEGQGRVALTSLRPGQLGVVCETCLDPGDASMLRAMGLRPNATVRVCRFGEPTILEILAVTPDSGPCQCNCSCRIGLAKELAARITVLPRV